MHCILVVLKSVYYDIPPTMTPEADNKNLYLVCSFFNLSKVLYIRVCYNILLFVRSLAMETAVTYICGLYFQELLHE